jgi:hypothetical protein
MNGEEYSFPKELKKLRACSSCGLIKTESQVKIINLIMKLLTI